MNTDEIDTKSTNGEGDDHIEVVVEDLFIEEYEVPLTLPPDGSRGVEATRALSHVRAHSTAWIGGVVAFGGLVLATLLGLKRRREPVLTRLLHRVGFAR